MLTDRYISKFRYIFTLCFLSPILLWAQNTRFKGKTEKELTHFFTVYHDKDDPTDQPYRLLHYTLNENKKSITITVSDNFTQQTFTEKKVKKIYKKVYHILPSQYRKYELRIQSGGSTIDQLVALQQSDSRYVRKIWKDINYTGPSWVRNVSKPYKISEGLDNRHIVVWASHGRYYDVNQGRWKWQRPPLFGTSEDLFTPTIVYPYLIPMLENAGAVVFTPKERDLQTEEVIVDNDGGLSQGVYQEQNGKEYPWVTSAKPGFAYLYPTLQTNDRPFIQGSVRMVLTSKKKKNYAEISYQPQLKTAGKRAVYVSYQTLDGSIDDAEYIVYHKGQTTHLKVNQQMGGGTWVYLGTFDFDAGCNPYNRVVLTNKSKHDGIVTADAVRFGGGMGNVVRGTDTSGVPRYLEGARYYAQWAGVPSQLYNAKGGNDDYADDINVRSFMTNWLSGGSVYLPTKAGLGVPIELSLAIHSDAGFDRWGDNTIGSLTICTTGFNEGKLNSGISRQASKDFASMLLQSVNRDLTQTLKRWNIRGVMDKNYSETRLPEMPSAILETMSHQSFADMKWGQDPNTKFVLARAIYKAMLHFVAQQHGESATIQPLPPQSLYTKMKNKGKVELRWQPTEDPQEPTAKPQAYIVYIAAGTSDFDNGTLVKGKSYTITTLPNVVYRYKVTAINKGGESFPSEIVSTYYSPNAQSKILVVNHFNRLSAPAVINTTSSQGFDLSQDPGVVYGENMGWMGYQQVFDKAQMGIMDTNGLGYTDSSLVGKTIKGNSFDNIETHVRALAKLKKYNIVSCSDESVAYGLVDLEDFDLVDIIMGLEKNDANALKSYHTFDDTWQKLIRNYTRSHGNILVSGAYIGSDMQAMKEMDFLQNTLRMNYLHSQKVSQDSTSVLIDSYPTALYQYPCAEHYGLTYVDVLDTVGSSRVLLRYLNGYTAGTIYKANDYGCAVLGFPLECITDKQAQTKLLQQICSQLLEPIRTTPHR